MDNAIYGSAKAWVRVTWNGSTLTSNASYNVSSVTRTGTGNYYVTFTNALTDANYSFTGVAMNSGTYGGYLLYEAAGLGTRTSSVCYFAVNQGSSYGDFASANLAVFR